MPFSKLGLSAELLRAIQTQGYQTPTPIQQAAIPAILGGRDLMACAQTGTGKTAAFVLPLLQFLGEKPVQRGAPRILILVPTRELAAQVLESVRDYGRHSRIDSLAVFGGVGINPQIQALRRGVDVLIATPGRLMDHMNQRTVDLRQIKTLVLDEADRMLDMGFIRDIRKIIAALPERRQNLMFSATYSDDIRQLAHGLLKDPQSIEVAPRNTTVETVHQTVIPCDREQKRDILLYLFQEEGLNQVLIFSRTKHGADNLSRRMIKAGIRTAALHGDKTQGARTRALEDFKNGRLHALVATDIAARGIDIDALPYVVNYDLPNVPEDYVHRIGRTGRAGAGGKAISLVCYEEEVQLRDIERLIKRPLEKRVIEGFEPSPPPRPVRVAPPARPRGNGVQNSERGAGATRPKTPGAPRRGASASGGEAKSNAARHRSGQRHG